MASHHGIEAQTRDIFKDRLSAEELDALFSQIGMAPSQMIATRSRPYRDLELADQQLTDAEILNLMAQYPALIRRPIVVTEHESLVGFNRPALEALIGRVNSE